MFDDKDEDDEADEVSQKRRRINAEEKETHHKFIQCADTFKENLERQDAVNDGQ